jgi:hypothetical protein
MSGDTRSGMPTPHGFRLYDHPERAPVSKRAYTLLLWYLEQNCV